MLLASLVGALIGIQHYRNQKIGILQPHLLPPDIQRAGLTNRGPKVYLIGDSQVAHWPLDAIQGWLLYRSGYPGEASANIVAATKPLLAVVKPDAVIVVMGGNDVAAAALLPEPARQTAIDGSIEAFRDLIVTAEQNGARQILVSRVRLLARASLPRWMVWGNETDAATARLNRGLETICEAPCHLVDLRILLDADEPRMAREYLSDDVHLNAKAYSRLAATFDSLMTELMNDARRTHPRERREILPK